MNVMSDIFLTPAAKARAITQKAKEDHLLIRPNEIHSEILSSVERRAAERQCKFTYSFWADEIGPIMENVSQKLVDDGFKIERVYASKNMIIISWEADEPAV